MVEGRWQKSHGLKWSGERLTTNDHRLGLIPASAALMRLLFVEHAHDAADGALLAGPESLAGKLLLEQADCNPFHIWDEFRVRGRTLDREWNLSTLHGGVHLKCQL